jgi:hypothetical protein
LFGSNFFLNICPDYCGVREQAAAVPGAPWRPRRCSCPHRPSGKKKMASSSSVFS